MSYNAWVTIQIGCDNTCTYCIVPSVRGEEISRPFDEIVDEVRRGVVGQLAQWRRTSRAALIEKLELKPRIAFGPLRTAISGRRISPPLFESMEILGKAETVARLRSFA